MFLRRWRRWRIAWRVGGGGGGGGGVGGGGGGVRGGGIEGGVERLRSKCESLKKGLNKKTFENKYLNKKSIQILTLFYSYIKSHNLEPKSLFEKANICLGSNIDLFKKGFLKYVFNHR